MKPRIDRPHWHEVSARAAKAEKLVAYILAEAERIGATKSAALNYAAQWQPLFWAIAARGAGVRMPSDHTITSVLAMLSRAALVERLVTDTEPRLSPEYDLRRLELVEP